MAQKCWFILVYIYQKYLESTTFLSDDKKSRFRNLPDPVQDTISPLKINLNTMKVQPAMKVKKGEC